MINDNVAPCPVHRLQDACITFSQVLLFTPVDANVQEPRAGKRKKWCATYPSVQVSKFHLTNFSIAAHLECTCRSRELTLSTEVTDVVYQKFVETAAEFAMDAKTVCGFIST